MEQAAFVRGWNLNMLYTAMARARINWAATHTPKDADHARALERSSDGRWILHHTLSRDTSATKAFQEQRHHLIS